MSTWDTFNQIHAEIDAQRGLEPEPEPTPEVAVRRGRLWHKQRAWRQANDTKAARAERQSQLAQVMREHPRAIFYKEWRQREAIRRRVSLSTVNDQYHRGLYPHLQLKRLNTRVVLVLNP